MKSNLDIYSEKTMIGKIAGVNLNIEEYKNYYSDATKDYDKRTRRIKSNYLVEKLKENDFLEEFEYKYIYDASACTNMGHFIFKIVPLVIIYFFKLSGFWTYIGIICSILLLGNILFNIFYWIPYLYSVKKKHFYLKSCYYINILATAINAFCVWFYLASILK